MNTQEFKKAADNYQKRNFAITGIIFLLSIPYLMLVMTHINQIRTLFISDFGGNIGQTLIGTIPFGPGIITTFVVLWLSEHRAKSDSRLRCPHCGKSWVTNRSIASVRANGNCPFCKTHITEGLVSNTNRD